MIEKPEPERTSIRYLLGEMSAQERDAFEDLYLGDTDLFHQLVQTESDLIDLYEMGALSTTEQGAVEQYLLARPEGPHRLRFARSLARYAESAAANLRDFSQVQASRLRFDQLPVPLSAVFVLLAVIGIFWFLITNHYQTIRLEALRNEQANASQRTQVLEQRLDSLARELAARGTADKQMAQLKPPGHSIASFTLRADTLRQSNGAPELLVPSSALFVTMRLVLPSESLASYNLLLENADGTIIWETKQARSHFISNGNVALSVKIPSHVLEGGDYSLRVIPSGAAEMEDIAAYPFHVAHR